MSTVKAPDRSSARSARVPLTAREAEVAMLAAGVLPTVRAFWILQIERGTGEIFKAGSSLEFRLNRPLARPARQKSKPSKASKDA